MSPLLFVLVPFTLAASDAPLKALLPRPSGDLQVEVGGDDGALDPGDRAHVVLSHRGGPLDGLLDAGAPLRVSLDQGDQIRWAYTLTLTAADVAGDQLRLPILPDATEPYPGERPLQGSRTVVDHLFDIGDPGQSLQVSVSTYVARTRTWVTLARAPLTWNLDRLSIGVLQDEQNARFRGALAAQNTWPEAGSRDASGRALAAGLVQRAVSEGDEVVGWNLAGAGWVGVRNRYGVLLQDVWTVNIGFRHGAECFVDEVKLVREYAGSRPGAPHITGTSAATARPIRCEAIGD